MTLSFIIKRVERARSHLLVLTASVGVASALVKNVGALAMLMPAAFQLAKKNGARPTVFLMPMSFASFLDGLMTLVEAGWTGVDDPASQFDLMRARQGGLSAATIALFVPQEERSSA